MIDDQDADFAAKVSNDVSEGIDCRETRAQLRKVIRWWASRACAESVGRISAESDRRVLRAVIHDALPYVRRSRSKRAKAIVMIAETCVSR